MDERTVLAIDPGSSKCGLALAKRDSDGNISLLWSKVAPRETVLAAVQEAAGVASASMFIVGGGTRSRDLVSELRDASPGTPILVVDEKDTSLRARERYWEHNPRRGWRRFLPATLQVPPEPVDDFVALILAERVLSS